ncbi:Trx7/PDZ domain-containing (seleno)protein [Rubritalea spongiae]|uniref:Trx7/PDZ domain-containing (Seleno)protein n=1 Tax=Rubritalea spongiae TaxID=430797 RepID=A0ABW5DZZ5_9BACT
MLNRIFLSLLSFVLFCTHSGAEENDYLPWHFSYQSALDEARKTNKPLIVEFRCAPCVNGREFDAQVLYTDPTSSRGKLLDQYVRARVTTMTGVDIAHFDRDWHNSLYYFIINADEDIYMRYGGRDEASATTYLNLESLELALQQGLTEHKKFLEGNRPSPSRPTKRTPADYPLIKKNVISSGRCTECHLIGDYTSQEKQLAGTLDPITDLYQSPDIKQLGLLLDIPKGLLLKEVTGPAKDAGIKAGDTITSINEQSVLTFGDLQYQYNKTPRIASSVQLTVRRKSESITTTIKLPFEWWKTDLSFRHWSLETQLYFNSESLSITEKQELQLPKNGFASRITSVDFEAFLSQRHQLKIGDIITSVNGRQIDPRTTDLKAHIQLSHSAGKKLQLTVIRDSQELELPLQTGQTAFRKAAENLVKTEQRNTAWSATDTIRKGSEIVVEYRATIANKHLIIEAKHHKGWHTYAIDNPQRAINLDGKKGNQELPTQIQLPAELKTLSNWKQSVPNNYSKPEIHWYTWGFEGTSYFAIELAKTPTSPTEIGIRSQACDATSCAGTFDMILSVPAPTNLKENLILQNILDSLEPTLPQSN